MDKTKQKKIIYINEIAFFFGWVIIFLMGADKPPPVGFLWLVLLIGALDVAQYYYLKYFLPKLNSKSRLLFIKNILWFLLGGIVVVFITVLSDLDNFYDIGILNTVIWSIVVISASVIYGTCFYIFNKLMLRL